MSSRYSNNYRSRFRKEHLGFGLVNIYDAKEINFRACTGYTKTLYENSSLKFLSHLDCSFIRCQQFSDRLKRMSITKIHLEEVPALTQYSQLPLHIAIQKNLKNLQEHFRGKMYFYRRFREWIGNIT